MDLTACLLFLLARRRCPCSRGKIAFVVGGYVNVTKLFTAVLATLEAAMSCLVAAARASFIQASKNHLMSAWSLMCHRVSLNIYFECEDIVPVLETTIAVTWCGFPSSLLFPRGLSHLWFGPGYSVPKSGHLLKHVQLFARFLSFPLKPTCTHLHIGSKVATHV